MNSPIHSHIILAFCSTSGQIFGVNLLTLHERPATKVNEYFVPQFIDDVGKELLNRLKNPNEANSLLTGIEVVTDFAIAVNMNEGRSEFPPTVSGLFALWKAFFFLLLEPLLPINVALYHNSDPKELFVAVMETMSVVVVAVFNYVTTFLQSLLAIHKAMNVQQMASHIAPCLTLTENPEQPIINFIAYAIENKFDGFQLDAFKPVHAFKVHIRGAYLYGKCTDAFSDIYAKPLNSLNW